MIVAVRVRVRVRVCVLTMYAARFNFHWIFLLNQTQAFFVLGLVCSFVVFVAESELTSKRNK